MFRKSSKDSPTLEEMTVKLGPEYAGLLPLALRNDSKLLSVVISLKRDGESFTKENLLPVVSEASQCIRRAYNVLKSPASKSRTTWCSSFRTFRARRIWGL